MKKTALPIVLLTALLLLAACSAPAPSGQSNSQGSGQAAPSAEANQQQAGTGSAAATALLQDCYGRDTAALVEWMQESAVYTDDNVKGYTVYAAPYQLSGMEGLLVANILDGALLSCRFEARGVDPAAFKDMLNAFSALGAQTWLAYDEAADSDLPVEIDALQIGAAATYTHVYASLPYAGKEYNVSVGIDVTEEAIQDAFSEYLGSNPPILIVTISQIE